MAPGGEATFGPRQVTAEAIEDVLGDVLKRDVVEGEAGVRARRQVGRAAGKMFRKRSHRTDASPNSSVSSGPGVR